METQEQHPTAYTPQGEHTATTPTSEQRMAAILARDPAELSDEEMEMRLEWERRQVERQKAIREAREESARRTANYWAKVNAEVSDNKDVAWFMRELGVRKEVRAAYRIDMPETEVAQCLRAAYKAEVELRGCMYMEDVQTQRTIADCARWVVNHKRTGLMLRGYVGVGKTTMLRAMRTLYQILAKTTIKIVDAREVAMLGRNDRRDELKSLYTEAMLGIDDLGTEPALVKAYGNDVSPVSEVLSQRYEKGLFTVVTTNLEKKEDDEIKTIYGERLYDRCKEMFNVVGYDSGQKSYRGRT